MTIDDASYDTSTRIGDHERNGALAELTAHLKAGRLSPAEFAQRSTAITQARTSNDLTPLFRDLPSRAGGTRSRRDSMRRRVQIVALSPIIATVIYLALGYTKDAWTSAWVVFLIIPAAAMLLITDLFNSGARRQARRARRERHR